MGTQVADDAESAAPPGVSTARSLAHDVLASDELREGDEVAC